MDMPPWLSEYEPQVPLKQLVEEVNKIFHSFDAEHYDSGHPEIHQQLPSVWAEMLAQLPSRQWRALDLGCGTGFEPQQVQRFLGDRLEKLLAFDPSPEMLAQCRRRLPGSKNVFFSSQFAEIAGHGPFNLLLTNSLLHHLPDIPETLSSLLPALTPDAFWLAGHEPSSRFYRNPECLSLLADFSRYRQRAKWLEPSSYIAKLALIVGKHPLRETAKKAFELGLFKQRPTPATIDRIVDFHVAHSADEATAGRGLDFEALQKSLSSHFKLQWVKTYAYFGAFNPTRTSARWRDKSQLLASRFPQDGANFSTIWSREP